MTRPSSKPKGLFAERAARRMVASSIWYRRHKPIRTRLSKHQTEDSPSDPIGTSERPPSIPIGTRNKPFAMSLFSGRDTLSTSPVNMAGYVSGSPSSLTLYISPVTVKGGSTIPQSANIAQDSPLKGEPQNRTDRETQNVAPAKTESEGETCRLVANQDDDKIVLKVVNEESCGIFEVGVRSEHPASSNLPPDGQPKAQVPDGPLDQEAIGSIEQYLNRHFENHLDTFYTEIENLGHLASTCLFSYYDSISCIESAHGMEEHNGGGLDEIARRLHMSYKVCHPARLNIWFLTCLDSNRDLRLWCGLPEISVRESQRISLVLLPFVSFCDTFSDSCLFRLCWDFETYRVQGRRTRNTKHYTKTEEGTSRNGSSQKNCIQLWNP